MAETHAPWRDRSLRDILARMRHDGCGGLAGKAELLTGIKDALAINYAGTGGTAVFAA